MLGSLLWKKVRDLGERDGFPKHDQRADCRREPNMLVFVIVLDSCPKSYHPGAF